MHDLRDFAMGFFVGILALVLFTLVIALWVREQGSAPCESKLPRTEKCVQIWVPEQQVKKGSQ